MHRGYNYEHNDEHKDLCLYFNREKLLKDINSNEHDIGLYLKNKNEKKFMCDVSYVDNGTCVFPHLSISNELLSSISFAPIDIRRNANINTKITSIKLEDDDRLHTYEHEKCIKRVFKIETLEYVFIMNWNTKFANKILENMNSKIKYLNIDSPHYELKKNNLNNLSNNLSILSLNGCHETRDKMNISYLPNKLLYLCVKTSNSLIIPNKLIIPTNLITPNKLNGIIIKNIFIRTRKFSFNVKYITLRSSAFAKTINITKYKKLVLFLICEKN